ncbi:MAG: heterodisulfide reductase-related iron-sulfur binding cluster [Bacteroidota bacterium]|nr:heterodisulfide reductase-related iron-sulfur binding cluster [Bacteroidota bacterium]
MLLKRQTILAGLDLANRNETQNTMKRTVFAPGCALMLYKPALADKIHTALNEEMGEMERLMTCCRHVPGHTTTTEIINVCPGCDKRFGSLYARTTTISLWEILAASDTFAFPDYGGQAMTILDACPTREKPAIHEAIRTLIGKMNIRVVEPLNTRTKSTCCGDSFYPQLPAPKVNELMKKRADEMPLEDVIVYCISCIQSVAIGGKTPRYLPDLLFGLDTTPNRKKTDDWHRELEEYIELH